MITTNSLKYSLENDKNDLSFVFEFPSNIGAKIFGLLNIRDVCNFASLSKSHRDKTIATIQKIAFFYIEPSEDLKNEKKFSEGLKFLQLIPRRVLATQLLSSIVIKKCNPETLDECVEVVKHIQDIDVQSNCIVGLCKALCNFPALLDVFPMMTKDILKMWNSIPIIRRNNQLNTAILEIIQLDKKLFQDLITEHKRKFEDKDDVSIQSMRNTFLRSKRVMDDVKKANSNDEELKRLKEELFSTPKQSIDSILKKQALLYNNLIDSNKLSILFDHLRKNELISYVEKNSFVLKAINQLDKNLYYFNINELSELLDKIIYVISSMCEKFNTNDTIVRLLDILSVFPKDFLLQTTLLNILIDDSKQKLSKPSNETRSKFPINDKENKLSLDPIASENSVKKIVSSEIQTDELRRLNDFEKVSHVGTSKLRNKSNGPDKYDIVMEDLNNISTFTFDEKKYKEIISVYIEKLNVEILLEKFIEVENVQLKTTLFLALKSVLKEKDALKYQDQIAMIEVCLDE